jgi:hypothetical protein
MAESDPKELRPAPGVPHLLPAMTALFISCSMTSVSSGAAIGRPT